MKKNNYIKKQSLQEDTEKNQLNEESINESFSLNDM